VSRLADTDVPNEVLARACAGDDAAREAIYRILAPATLTLIRRVVGQRALAEDIFQDTMMTLYERLPQFRREAPLGAWLRQIALSRCLMCLRSPWQRARLCLARDRSDAPRESATPAPEPDAPRHARGGAARPEGSDLRQRRRLKRPAAPTKCGAVGTRRAV